MEEKSGSTYHNNLRRVFHFVTITTTALIYGLSPWTWEQTMPVLSVIILTFIAADLLRLHINALNNFVQKHLNFILRKHEQHELSGSSWYLLSAMISLSLFPKPIAVLGFLCLAVGDPLASYVGIATTQGQQIGKKTWAGCWAFFLVSWLVGGLWLLPIYGPLLAFSGAAIGSMGAALIERALIEIDDNLIIPLAASGLTMAWFNYYGLTTIL